MTDNTKLIIMAGPCAVESERQIMTIAEVVAKVGGHYLRGGAFKPRTRSGDWEGLGLEGLRLLQKAGAEYNLKLVTEILGPIDKDTSLTKTIEIYRQHGVALFQVGARNAANQFLLNGLGAAGVDALLKNGMNMTIEEWRGSASRLSGEVMLCARGKNNETVIARNGQDITTIEYLVNHTPYKIIFDPSHIAGKREYIFGITMAAIATGVDGIIVEVHPDPVIAKTDGRQSITPKQLEALVVASHAQRSLYLAQKELRESFHGAQIPAYVDIYFREEDLERVAALVKDLETEPYQKPGTGILASRISIGTFGQFRHHGLSIGELVRYSPKEGEGSAQAILVTTPTGDRIKMTPYSEAAVRYRGKTLDPTWPGERVELVRGFAGQPIRDAFLTIDMGRVPKLSETPLIIYRTVKE